MKYIYNSFWLLIFIGITVKSSGQIIKVTLLGTGNPQPTIQRFGPGTLIEAGGQFFLFDCGRGVTQRLWQNNIQLGKVHKLFLTHLHSDHVVGIPDFWLTGWLPANFGKRSVPMKVWGPSGTKHMMQSLQEAFAWDINTRQGENNKNDSGIMVIANDIKEGIVYEQDGIKITAFTVDHADFIDAALGYRFDYEGKSVVISGDTRYNENLIKFAEGTNVLIHEVAIARPELIEKSATARQILSFHTSPEDAGKVFAKVKPELAVYNHISLVSTDPAIPAPTIDELISRTRKYFNGFVEVGEDLMIIEIADKVIIKRFPVGNK